MSAEAALYVVESGFSPPETDQLERVWLCDRTFQWSVDPRPSCVGKAGSNSPGHPQCGWFPGSGDEQQDAAG